jgi:Xaa-Pro dipeptidase
VKRFQHTRLGTRKEKFKWRERMAPTHASKKPKLSAQSYFSMGKGTLRVPMALHRTNRAAVTTLLLSSLGKRAEHGGGVLLLQGGEQTERHDTDNEPLFRQESYFHYLFGVREAGCYGAISLPDGAATLFVPKLGKAYEIVCGKFPTPQEFQERYQVDAVSYVDELVPWLEEQLERAGTGGVIHTLAGGVNTDSGAAFPPPTLPPGAAAERLAARFEASHAYLAAAEARSKKSEAEVDLMTYTYALASAAHVATMRAAKPGAMEYQLEALFLHHAYANGGARSAAYTPICASGPNGAVLHYGHAGRPNDRQISEGDMLLLDMGCEYACYASDITNSFPAAGKYSERQRLVYNAVLAAQLAVVQAMRPGVAWSEMHRLAERTMLQALADGGLLTGDVTQMLDSDLGAIFMPHGLGHLIGVDTHDVGGYLPGHPPRSTQPGVCRLRTARVLEAGMLITVEPGCYFIDALLDDALADPRHAPFLVPSKLAEFRGSGGVRIEDGVLVTADGACSLASCPRSIDEVESVLAGGEWPPTLDRVPSLRRSWTRLAADGSRMEPLDVPSA